MVHIHTGHRIMQLTCCVGLAAEEFVPLACLHSIEVKLKAITCTINQVFPVLLASASLYSVTFFTLR